MVGEEVRIDQVTDNELVARVVERDEEAFEELYRRYHSKSYSLMYGMLKNHEITKDASTTLWVQVWLKAHTFKGDARFSTWLYRVAWNTAAMQMRKMRSAAKYEDRFLPYEQTLFLHADPVDFIARDRLRLVAKASKRMRRDYKLAIGCLTEGMTAKEFAISEGITLPAAKSIVNRARVELRARCACKV